MGSCLLASQSLLESNQLPGSCCPGNRFFQQKPTALQAFHLISETNLFLGNQLGLVNFYSFHFFFFYFFTIVILETPCRQGPKVYTQLAPLVLILKFSNESPQLKRVDIIYDLSIPCFSSLTVESRAGSTTRITFSAYVVAN